MTEHMIRVLDRACRITVQRRSRTAYVAIGEYLGQRVEATGRKEGYAVMAWADAAKALRPTR